MSFGGTGVFFLAAILACFFISGQGQNTTCPTFGTDQSPSSLSRSREERIFMNFESPAQCRGNVTGWRFCYYRNVDNDFDEISNSRIFAALFIVYRRQSATSNNYMTVPGSVREKQIEWRNIQGSSFQCSNEDLAINEYFEIQENDVVGACIKDVGSIDPLLLVGTSSGSNLLTYQWDERDYQECLTSQYSTVDTSHNDFRTRRTSTLHLYANIAVTTSCTAGSNIAPAVAVTSGLTGTYLNVESPVSCNNHITKWHYCYYPQATTPGSTLSMTVAVWSLDVATNTYIVNPSSIKNITLQPVQTLAKVFCLEEALDESEFVLVSQNDVIGVSLPSSNAIPILGSNANPSVSLKRHTSNAQPSNITTSELTDVSSSVLHIHATIEYRDLPTTSPETTMKPTEEVMTTLPPMTFSESTTKMFTQQEAADTTETNTKDPATSLSDLNKEAKQGHKLGGGDISAIILSLLVVIGVVVMTTLLFLYIKQRRRKYSMHTKEAFDNVMYDAGPGLKGKERVTIYDSMVEPYIYSDDQTLLRSQSHNYDSNNEYQIIEDYCTPMNDASAYQHELEQVKRGSTLHSEGSIYSDPGNNEEEIYSFLKNRKIQNIPENTITMGSIIGSGQFGTVYEGEWQPKKEIINVALKSFKEHGSSSDKVKFLQEAAIMAQFHHPNVVSLYGVTDKKDMMMLVVEYLAKGDLHQYLNTLMPDPGELVPASTAGLLLQFSQQIALGMGYLASTGFVHRDLAARNVLISHSMICKIADFGMSRNLDDDDYYTASGGKIPLKWTAPEAIHYKKFSAASDVWSYGCVLYEIWSLGHKPFEQLSNIEVIQVVDSGGRLASPPGCPRLIYQVMIKCWNPKPRDRPKFRDIILSLLDNEEVVLNIPLDVTNIHPLAATLGAPLKAGFHLYKDLQTVYMTN